MKLACQYCKKFFRTKHGRNIHEHWCVSNPNNYKTGAPPERKDSGLTASETHLEADKPKLIVLIVECI